ncbi:hypothetical protein ACPA9J_11085 [Pseudomonas aeruginosa]
MNGFDDLTGATFLLLCGIPSASPTAARSSAMAQMIRFPRATSSLSAWPRLRV